MATIQDLLNSGMSREEINALLSQSTVSTSGYEPSQQQRLSDLANPANTIMTPGFDPLGTTGRGEPYMPPQPLPQNYIQNERTGDVTDLGQSQPAGPAMDYSSPVEFGGMGKGYRLKGDATRAVMADGRIIDMGRDTRAERARIKEDLGLQKQRGDIAQTDLENKAKQMTLAEASGLATGGKMTAKQYEASHGKIPSGFEIYRTETGETDIRPVQGGKQYLELQDRVHKFDSSGKGMDEYGTQLDKLTKHPGRESATGFSSITNPLALPGGDAKDFLNELETFQSQAFLSNIDKLRGTGPLSNVEGEKLQAAVGNLNVSSNEETFKKNLMDVKRRFESLKEKAKMDADNARGEMKREKPKLTSADGEAIAWAMKNPTDPRAAVIKERLGVR